MGKKNKQESTNIKSVVKILPVDLTDAEIRKKSLSLIEHEDELESENERWKGIKKGIESKIEIIKRALRTGQEDRNVDVNCVKDFDAGLYYEQRLDTGVRIHERDLYESEKQMEID